MLVIGELLLVQEPHAPQKIIQLISGLESLFVPCVIQSIKLENLLNLITHNELQFQVFVKSQSNKTLSVNLDFLRWQENPQISANTTVWLVKWCHLKLFLRLYKTIIDLLVFVHRVDGVIVVRDVPLHLKLFNDVLRLVLGLKNHEKVDIPVDFLLW